MRTSIWRSMRRFAAVVLWALMLPFALALGLQATFSLAALGAGFLALWVLWQAIFWAWRRFVILIAPAVLAELRRIERSGL